MNYDLLFDRFRFFLCVFGSFSSSMPLSPLLLFLRVELVLLLLFNLSQALGDSFELAPYLVISHNGAGGDESLDTPLVPSLVF